MSSFDYYQASVSASPESIIPALIERYSHSSVDHEKATNGYERACVIHRGDRKLVSVQWGGNTGDMTQIKGTGEDAPLCAEFIRELWPEHRLQRADVCEDYSEDGIWETMSDYGLYLAVQYALKIDQKGDWARNDMQGRGRTLYLGSRQSLAFLRIYEKGKEKAVRSGTECTDPNHVRAEAEIKPQNKVQAFALAKLEPRDYWRCSPWMNQYSTILFQEDMERIRLWNVKKTSDDDMAFEYMLKQYGAVMARQIAANGEDYVMSKIRQCITILEAKER
jgi:DNA relaxase NicK